MALCRLICPSIVHYHSTCGMWYVVAIGRMVTSSPQITEVKQRQVRLVLGWVTAAQSSHPTGHV